MNICSIEGCERKHHAKGFCETHYARLRRHGTVNLKPKQNKKCSIDGCESKHYGNGFCALHCNRMRKHGDPHKVLVKRWVSGRCSIEGCDNKHKSRSFCEKHSRRIKKYGDPFRGPLSDEERFQSKIIPVPECGCWIWTAQLDRKGYGCFSVKGRPVGAHRVSWELHNGSIPEGLCVCHKCDTPSCVNPEHLFLGTYQDNSNDAVAKGRIARGEGHVFSKLTERQVIEIRVKLNAHSKTETDMAIEYNVSRKSINNIKRRKVWKHI